MAVRNEIQIGQDSRYNGMTMFRKVDNVPFNPQYSFDENDNLSMGSNITVNYIEYFKNSEGVIVPELTKHKYYVVANREGWEAANNWFMTLARTPITAPYGIMDGIEETLRGLPMEVPNGYVLQQAL